MREIRLLCLLQAFYTTVIKKAWKASCASAHDDGGGGTLYYIQMCKFLKLEHHIFIYHKEKNIVERTIQYIKEIELKVLMTIFNVKRKRIAD